MIAFLQPLALFGLLAVVVPPLLHLIGRRVPPLVTFPPLRYLSETERKHSRRLKLRNLLLLLLRMAVIALIALAAARPVTRLPLGGDHEPSALALVLDNSLSSGAIVDGRRVLDVLAGRARHVLDRADGDDRLWMVVADGVPRRVTLSDARRLVDTLPPWPLRLDVGAAVRAAAEAMAGDRAPGHEVVVVSDLQASALPGGPAVPARVLFWSPPGSSVQNRGIDSVWAEPPVWSPSGRVVGAIGGSGADPVTVRLTVEEADVDRSFGAAGDRVVLEGAPPPGWHAAAVSLDPDELRADDSRALAVRVSPPASVAAGPTVGRFVTDGVGVLQAAGRAGRGSDVVLDDAPGPGTVILFPPEDPARIGAVNRDLRNRGVPWQFGEVVEGEWQLPEAWSFGEGVSVYRRRALVGSEGVVAALGGAPWIVRAGDAVLVGSRLEPGWTGLPVSAGFVPFLDMLINRIAATQAWIVRAGPGEPVEVPESAEVLLDADGAARSLGDGPVVAPMEPGVYFLAAGTGDTVGALEVNHDPRESSLEAATEAMLRGAVGPGAMLLGDAGVDRELFRGARRADLTGVLVLLALVLAVGELLMATVGGSRAADA